MMRTVITLMPHIFGVVFLGGCAFSDYVGMSYDRNSLQDGVILTDESQYDSYTSKYISVLTKIKQTAGVSTISDKVSAKKVGDAGFIYVDSLCNRYFDSLEALNRNQQVAGSEVNIIGTGVSALLTAVRVSSAAIGTVATGFGSVGAYINSEGKRYLFDNAPYETKTLISNVQTTFKGGVTYSDNPNDSEVYGYIQSYAAICTPVSIESYVKKAIASGQSTLTQQPQPGVTPNTTIASNSGATGNSSLIVSPGAGNTAGVTVTPNNVSGSSVTVTPTSTGTGSTITLSPGNSGIKNSPIITVSPGNGSRPSTVTVTPKPQS